MEGTVFSFLMKYRYVILFYLIILLFLILKRKKLTIQSKVIVLYRMKWGLRFMEKISKKHRQLIILWGYIGVGIAYLGLGFISYFLIKNLFNLITKPTTASGVSLVLPGIEVPGLGVLSFWYWLLAIFIIALVHEFSHGVVAKAHRIRVKNTGLVFLGPIIGAFVEPDEKKLEKETDIKQYSILAAGSFSNLILGLVALLVLSSFFIPWQQKMIEPIGFSFEEYYGKKYPAAQSKLPLGTVIKGINGEKITNFQEFSERLFCLSSGEKIILNTAEKNYSLTLTAHPENPRKPFLGIKKIKNEFKIKEEYQKGFQKTLYYFVDWISGFLKWLFLLSVGIGLFNLLPLPIVDGGRMLQVYLHKRKGKIKGEKIYRRISFFFLLILVVTLLYPLIKKLLGI